MKTINILLGLSLLLLCPSCGKKEHQANAYSTPEATVIKIPSELNLTSFDKVIKKMDFIPLETSDSYLISRVVQVKCTDSLIFINNNRRQVLVFDKKGKFRNQIGNNGSGPGEYREVRDFFLNKDTVKILDFCKIENYSFTGKHIMSRKIDFGDQRISPNFFINAPSGDGYYFWAGTTGHNDRNSRKKYHFMYKTDNDLYVTDSIFSIKHSAGGNTRKFFNVDSCTVLDPLLGDYNIYQIAKDNKISTRYVLDFGDKTLTNNILEEVDRKNGDLFYAELDKYVIQMSNFAENSKWVLLNFSYKQRMYCILYCKATATPFVITPTRALAEKGEFLFWGAQACMNDRFAYLLEASWFVEISEQLPEEAKKKYGLDKEHCKKIKDTDNPVLVLYTMRDE
ncbi:6-bladed beta-propeller [Phocaeicola sp.]